MLRRMLFLFGIVVVLLIPCFAVSVDAGSSTWSKTYGGPGYDYAVSVVNASDGGYAIAGTTDSFGAGGADFWLVKTDGIGNMVWNRTYGGTENDRAKSLIGTSDGGYAVAGETFSSGAGNYDFWLVKTNSSGDVEWSKTYGGERGDTAFSVVEALDGGYVIAGDTHSSVPNWFDAWLVKTDEFGNMEWNQTYGGQYGDTFYWVVVTSDGGYMLAGPTNAGYSDETSGFWVIKTDELGTAEWNKTYESTLFIGYSSFAATSDGGYVLAGTSSGNTSANCFLFKTDAAGDVEWNQTYEALNKDYVTSLVRTPDGGYAIGGYSNSSGAGGEDFWLIKTDSVGNMEWKNSYGGVANEQLQSLIATSDGRYVAAGFTFSFETGDYDLYLVNFDGHVDMYEFKTYEFDFSYGYGTYIVVVSTNSTLGGFDFGIGQNQISFFVMGPPGTNGAAKILIPEDLTNSEFPVYLGEEQLVEGVNYTKTYNGTHTIINMTYSHSTHLIEITGTNVIPEYNSWFIPTMLIATVLLAVVNRKKLSK